jgi:molybdenum cofactor cytidylyltransferase
MVENKQTLSSLCCPVKTDPFHFGAIVLAAGASTRMGAPKQLLRLGGRTLLRRTVDAVLASPAWPIVVVLGAHLDAIRPEVARLPVLVVENSAWEEGLASSIRAGARVLASFSLSLDAALLVLCDQPNLSPEAIARLADATVESGKTIVAARYGDHSGPPALFSRRHFQELTELRGPGGARPLLARHADLVAMVDLPELAADLDTPAEYASFQRTLENEPSVPTNASSSTSS